jgi:hypothetical protein
VLHWTVSIVHEKRVLCKYRQPAGTSSAIVLVLVVVLLLERSAILRMC